MSTSETVRAELDAAIADADLERATRRLQHKVLRQAAALDTLHRRVVTQRFVLRTLDELGRSLSPDEYAAARARVGDDALPDRIDPPR
ncbi:hypothetical protein [Dactylosporangium sp. CA-139066]|uniref:hypothetical protein n=1 Tax=Dactylosporangium sp. CA-139066 TaxID=3239930 RepID=UPI003D8F8A64